MEDGFVRGENRNWIAPLPFRKDRPRLENNLTQALQRARNLQRSLLKDTVKAQQFTDFMQKMLDNGHAEKAPNLRDDEEFSFLPIFAVYHPRKPGQARVVFDSSAQFRGSSLNEVLLTGPDLTNSLLGVLLRFRQEPVAVVADVQQMFYCFYVNREHRNYLRFLWHDDNDLAKPLVHYRMCVHVFGNSPSPAVATYGLRKAVNGADEDVIDYVERNFYVDDGLGSCKKPEEAIILVKKTQCALMQGGNIKLHKIASNRQEVMEAFPQEDLAKYIKDLDLRKDFLPLHTSIGIGWELEADTFLIRTSPNKQPFTRRGILSTVNGIFDPIGFMAPVVIQGKLLLRELIHGTINWDAPLPEQDLDRWDRWRISLVELNNVKIPRLYLSSSFSACEQKTVHVFCDASEKAIAAVGYLQGTLPDDRRSLGFVLGKAKVAPLHGHSIPRLELCSALLAVEIAETISNHLGLALQDFRFYSDSKVVLGYIYNTARRFHTYVANRLARILSSTSSRQWSYVMTDNNPADQGTRSLRPSEMQNSTWLIGPTSLVSEVSETAETYELHNPDSDNEIRRITTIKTDVHVVERLGCERFARFSRWESLLKAIIFLKLVARSVSKSDIDQKNDSANKHRQDSTHFLLKNAQRESYPEEIQCLQNNKPLSNSSYIRALRPFLDDNGLIRVGGRLERAQVPYEEKHPILLPGRHHMSLLLARHFHEKVFHQGRQFTEGSIRAAGYWFTGCRRLVSSLISQCVKCRKLRVNYCCQKMADLPADRLEPGPPFSNVGVDAFGPWQIVSRRTRGCIANSKRWGIIFTCLVTRAVHIEVVDSMSSSAFINALRRFIAIRGKVNIFRSDRGTNFVGAMDDLGVDRINVENNVLREFFDNVGTKWILNPPHAPHFGGAWERLIGIVKRILSAILSEPVNQHLTHDVFCTLMAEVTAIVN